MAEQVATRVKAKYQLTEINSADKTITLQRQGSQIIVANPDYADDLRLVRDPDVAPWYVDTGDMWASFSPFDEPPCVEEPIDSMVKAFFEDYPVELEVSFEKRYGTEHKYKIHAVHIHKKKEVVKTAVKLGEIDVRPIDRVRLKVGRAGYTYIQSDGYLLYAAMSGEGKTYFAIDNIPHLVDKFGKVIILAYEITPLDYLNRLCEMLHKSPDRIKEEFGDSVIIETEIDIGKLKRTYSKKNGYRDVAFIVDNVDSLPLEIEGEAHYQSRWLKQFDNYLKSNGYFGVVLSQMKKQQEKFKKEELTQYDVAGSKDRVDLSRSTIFTWFDEVDKNYKYRPLKLGSMKRDSDTKWLYSK